MKQNDFIVEVQKTDKVDVDEGVHVLPPANGVFKEYRVADFFCPDEWSKDGTFISVEEGQPLWFDFRGNDECAILPSVQRLNPITGEPSDLKAGISKDPTQNYLWLPRQLWLDGYLNDGKVYQFVVTKQGIGLAVNEFLLPKHMQDSHALGFAFYAPKNPKPKPEPEPEPEPEFEVEPIEFSHMGWVPPIHPRKIHMFPHHYGETDIIYTSSGTSPVFKSSGIRHISAVNAGDFTMHEACGGGDEIHGIEASIDCVTANNVSTTQNSGGTEATNENVSHLFSIEVESPEVVNILEDDNQKVTDCDKASMGAGGRIDQRVISDENTVEYYHDKPDAVLNIYLALPEMFEAIMKKGKRQDKERKDTYKKSGKIGGIQVPLMD